MKVCTKCKIEKDKEEFYWTKTRKGTKTKNSWCKRCCQVYHNISPEAKARKNKKRNEKRAQIRLEALTHYSNGLMKCACCGEATERFLTLDHINDDGWEHKKRVGRSTLYSVKEEGYPEGIRVLCYNCNCGRAHNNGVCPHEEI